MRLTQSIRQAFVHSAMNDVPSIDYKEQIRTRINELAKKYRKAAGLPEAELQRYVDSYLYPRVGSMHVTGLLASEKEAIEKDSDLGKLIVKSTAQTETRDKLEQKLTGIANSVNTSKALIELLPEFEKYLPAEAAKASNLPAISNMVGDFIRAGWPKNKATTATAGATP
jgi:hypothetical protein